jgi:hypothetical protein
MLSPGSPARGAFRAGAILLFLAGLTPFWSVRDVSFLKDDLNLLQLAGPDGRASFDAWVHWFGWPKGVYAHDQFYRPLPMLLGFAEFAAAGPVPGAFRVSNLIVHAAVGVLLASLLQRLTRGKRPFASLLVGLLFVLHPAHGEAVVWIAQRFVLHAAFWTLLALHGLESFLSGRRFGGAVLATFATLAAVLSKETAAAAPALYGAYALLRPDERPLPERVRTAVKVAAVSGLATATVLGLRYALFGAVSGTYGGVSIAEYARSRRTFERLPESLWNGLVGCNAAEAPAAFRTAVAGAIAALVGLALLALWRARRDPDARRVAVFGVAFAAASLGPMLPVFYCEPWLAGARFLYQPFLGVAAALAAGMFAATSRRPYGATTAVAVFAVAGAANLPAYRGADLQIAAVREGLLAAAAARPEAAFVLHRTPTEFRGVPTIDLYAPLLVKPPLHQGPAVPVFPVVAGGETTFDAAAFARFRADHPGRPLEHLYCVDRPPGIAPLFAPAAAALGEAPVVRAPEDGAAFLVANRRGLPVDAAVESAAAETGPEFRFRGVADAARYRFRFALAEGGLPEPLPAPRTFALTREVAALRRDGEDLLYRFADGADELPAGAPDPWLHLMRHGFDPPPLLASCEIEALDARGRTLGVSAPRRIVVFPRPASP